MADFQILDHRLDHLRVIDLAGDLLAAAVIGTPFIAGSKPAT
jgi:hypothetical protein